ncbi:universal stress protein [Acinetobacter qingfengensis]|uniref:Universal stress protein n=1 Tax=Acinetobacter qingfengensis TaxID=1262585 RepID=A0A1E7QYT0_9GAMM|nr:universal stress protein [Acinetobacter qingfengensis]KAA8731402.1 universal stress protein [Acinetobacter qingfengensis]OEY92193.1 universal stress protein [Acinetobacter qingfengensis]
MTRVIACIDASPCVNATAEAAAWVAQKTGRELILLQVLDYRPASYHLGEISGVIGFESNAMLLKELAELDEKQYELAQKYSDDLLKYISKLVRNRFSIEPKIIQRRGDFLEQCFDELQQQDIVVVGKIGENAAENDKPVGSNVEGLIRGAKSTVLTVGEKFVPPASYLFAYEYSPVCQNMVKRIEHSDLLRGLTCHLVYVGDQNGILDYAIGHLQAAGIDVKPEYIYGDVAETLLQYQDQHHTGLMVMGAFSHSKLHQFFLGSTTLTIFKESEVPMLVLR